MSAVEPVSIAMLESERFHRALAPGLAITTRVREASRLPDPPPWPRSGWLAVPNVVPRERAAEMAAAIEALAARGVSPTFAYVFDAFWEPIATLRSWAEAIVGPCEVLADGWAWRIPPGSSQRGWGVHRDSSIRQRSPNGGPALLNVWLALTDVDETQSAVHVVPLDRDPAYAAGQLDDHTVPDGAAVPLHGPAGTAFVWDANALHWGGPSTDRARGPRISCSYTIATTGPRAIVQSGAIDFDAFGLEARLDTIARMMLHYRAYEAMPPEIEAWARASVGLSQMRAKARG